MLRGIHGCRRAGIACVEIFDLRAKRIISVFHKHSPDRRGSASALSVGAIEGNALIIEAHPHAGGVFRCVANEPRIGVVLRSSRFSGRQGNESNSARASRFHAGRHLLTTM